MRRFLVCRWMGCNRDNIYRLGVWGSNAAPVQSFGEGVIGDEDYANA
jgi:hypothetical protein